MIELHRSQTSSFSDRIEETLHDLVVAHKVCKYSEEPSEKPPEHPLPFIKESSKVVEGEENLKVYLFELEKELKQQRAITADACYIDPETGEVC